MVACLAAARVRRVQHRVKIPAPAAFDVAHEAVQLHGATGLAAGTVVEKLFRDARGGLIGDGCNRALALERSRDLIENYTI